MVAIKHEQLSAPRMLAALGKFNDLFEFLYQASFDPFYIIWLVRDEDVLTRWFNYYLDRNRAVSSRKLINGLSGRWESSIDNVLKLRSTKVLRVLEPYMPDCKISEYAIPPYCIDSMIACGSPKYNIISLHVKHNDLLLWSKVCTANRQTHVLQPFTLGNHPNIAYYTPEYFQFISADLMQDPRRNFYNNVFMKCVNCGNLPLAKHLYATTGNLPRDFTKLVPSVILDTVAAIPAMENVFLTSLFKIKSNKFIELCQVMSKFPFTDAGAKCYFSKTQIIRAYLPYELQQIIGERLLERS